MSERPLHIQVAEALGCNLFLQQQMCIPDGDYWRCGCKDKFQKHGDLIDVYRYDTDWSVTGPLIEKYVAHLHNHPHGWTAVAHDEAYAYHDPDGLLVSVCNLILVLKKAGKL